MNVLLPTDFSDCARNASDYAIKMFGEEHHYILLNVYLEPRSSADMLVSIKDILEKQSKRELHNELERLSKAFPGIVKNIEIISEYGQLAVILNHLVHKENIDFVVMGTKGASGLSSVFMGSNTTQVIKKVKCPVLAIPENCRYRPIHNIAFASDYMENENGYMLDPLTWLITKYNAKLQVINFRPEGAFVKAEQVVGNIKLNHLLQDVPHHFYNLQSDDVTEGINEFVHQNNSDLITMISRHHSFFQKLTHGSFTKKMTLLTETPLLVLHEK